MNHGISWLTLLHCTYIHSDSEVRGSLLLIIVKANHSHGLYILHIIQLITTCTDDAKY